MAIKLTGKEWAVLTQALGQFLGGARFLADGKPDGIFAEQAKTCESLIEKVEGSQFMQYGLAGLRRAAENIAEKEIELQKKIDFRL